MIACGSDAKGRGSTSAPRVLSMRPGRLVVTPQSIGLLSWLHPTTGNYCVACFIVWKALAASVLESAVTAHLMEYLHLICLLWIWDHSCLPTRVLGPLGILAMPIRAHKKCGQEQRGYMLFPACLVGSKEWICGSCCSANSRREVRAYLNVHKHPKA